MLIAFDDGWRDNLIYVYPILKNISFQAILFVVISWVDYASKEFGIKDRKFDDYSHQVCVERLNSSPLSVLLTCGELNDMWNVFDI